MTNNPKLGFCFSRSFAPTFLPEVAQRLEADGVDHLWIIEDCFFTGGVSLAAAALATTSRIEVGIGILPAVARNPVITAMELATLARMAPGRLIGGIGHGVQSWMEQIGERTPSPLTTLDEVISCVRRLLRGERVTFAGREVTLTDVQLDQPPEVVPPVLAGVRGPKSLQLAGRVADGLVLAEGAGPAYVAWAIEQAQPQHEFRTSVFTAMCITEQRAEACAIMAPVVGEWLDGAEQAIRLHPRFDDLLDRWGDGGPDALATMPPDWWRDLGAIGTLDDVRQHVEALGAAGADDVALFPASEVEIARTQLDDLRQLTRSSTRAPVR